MYKRSPDGRYSLSPRQTQSIRSDDIIYVVVVKGDSLLSVIAIITQRLLLSKLDVCANRKGFFVATSQLRYQIAEPRSTYQPYDVTSMCLHPRQVPLSGCKIFNGVAAAKRMPHTRTHTLTAERGWHTQWRFRAKASSLTITRQLGSCELNANILP